MPSKRRVFLDTSVLIAATLSTRGGSRVILELAQEHYLTLVLTRGVVQEAHRSLARKVGLEKLTELYRLLKSLRPSIKPTPVRKALSAFDGLIEDQNDRHILAGALRYRVNVLVTLDRRHFLTLRLKEAGLPFIIQTPQQFLQDFRADSDLTSR